MDGQDFGYFEYGFLLPQTGSGASFSLVQPDPVWIQIFFLLKLTSLVVCLKYIKPGSNKQELDFPDVWYFTGVAGILLLI